MLVTHSRYALGLVLASIACLFLISTHTQAASPGLERYEPTRLEWAALELQASYGRSTITAEEPITVDFIPRTDGQTILCYIQAFHDYPDSLAQRHMKTMRDVFDALRDSRGWEWLRFEAKLNTSGNSRPWLRPKLVTELEWLLLELQAEEVDNEFGENDLIVSVGPGPSADGRIVVRCHIAYRPTASAQVVQTVADGIRRRFALRMKAYPWAELQIEKRVAR